MNIQYQDKWAFIIGGSTGIGFSLAKEFLARKAKVLIIARNTDTLLQSSLQLQKLYPDAIIKDYAADATDETAIKNLFLALSKEEISPSFLINCAGRAIPDYFENISTQQLKDTFNLNVITAWNSIQAALPYMKKSGGYIINTSSIAGFLGIYGYSDYSASKFALIGLSETLKSELLPFNIQVSVLCPPDTDTPGFQEENKTKPKETITISSNTKLVSPDIVAKAALKELEKGKFILLVDSASRITWILKKLMPNLLFRIIQRDVNKVQKGTSK